MGPGIVQILMAARHPGFAPEEVAACLSPQHSPEGLLQFVLDLAIAAAGRRALAELVDRVARFTHAMKRRFLRVGTGPLDETRAVMPTGVPRGGSNVHVTVSAKGIEI